MCVSVALLAQLVFALIALVEGVCLLPDLTQTFSWSWVSAFATCGVFLPQVWLMWFPKAREPRELCALCVQTCACSMNYRHECGERGSFVL